jgi:hypothetical protein
MSDADVAEVIIYNRVLTASELQGVRNYLAAKYAVAGSGECLYLQLVQRSNNRGCEYTLCRNIYRYCYRW